MGNGVYFKMIRCCYTNKNLNDADINVDGNIKDINYINYKNNQYINEDEIQNKNDPKIIATKSKQSSRSGSQNKVKQNGENSSNKDQNLSLCNNTMQINNSNLIKNNLIQNNLYNNRYNYNDQNEENRYKNSVINYNKNDNIKDNYIDIKTKLLLFGELFSNEIIEINKNGMKNSLKQRKDGLTIFGIKENTNSNDTLSNMCDYYLDLEKIDEINNNNNKLSGKVFEIYINKITRSYELYFLNNSLILYYKINNNIFFDLDKDYYLILGDIFLTILIKKSNETNEKIIHIQTEIENEKPKKYSFGPNEMPIKIGRINCNINISKPSISKTHSIIDFMDDNFYYKDCGSTNGSTLLIREDDTLKINGTMSFKLEDISFKIKEVEDNENYIEENDNE
jgi:hypothetical protein